MSQRLFLRKTPKEKIEENPKLPYFTLVLIPEEGDENQDWQEVGAFWKAKSGNGYSVKTNDEATIVIGDKESPIRSLRESAARKSDEALDAMLRNGDED